MRRWAGALLLAAGSAACAASFLASPYTSWGVEEEQVRWPVAELIVQLSGASLGLLVAGAILLLGKGGRVGGRNRRAVAASIAALAAVAAARLLWVRFHVLG
jgi:hypothetical protein